MRSNKKVLRLVQLSLLVALVVVLQIISASIPPIAGAVSITLTLVPVVVGGIMLGVSGGAVLGFAFGGIVLINCISGMDPGGNILWSADPGLTAVICFVKGVCAGVVPSLVYKAVAGKKPSGGRAYAATLLSAMAAPIINTGLFVCGMLLFFRDTLNAWAGGTNVMIYILTGLAGINFAVELGINIFLTPAVSRIVDAVRKKKVIR